MKLQDLVTDNEGDLEIVSVVALASAAVLLALTVYVVVVRDEPFDMQNFGIAVGVILGGAGGGYHLKANQYSRGRTPRTDDLDH